jgi:hypothetical protein
MVLTVGHGSQTWAVGLGVTAPRGAEFRPMRTNVKRALLLAGTISVLAAVLSVTPAAAATGKKKSKSPGEVVYRCRDAKGQSYFGQSIPAECMEADVEVLDETGRVVRIVPGRRTLEETAALRNGEEVQKASAQRDRTLLATYLSVADIERLRDQRVELLEQQAHVTQQYIANLREREARLAEDVQRFRPYNMSPKAPVLPDHIAENIVSTVNGRQIYEQELAKTTAEQQRLRSEFDADIARFKELKGLK